MRPLLGAEERWPPSYHAIANVAADFVLEKCCMFSIWCKNDISESRNLKFLTDASHRPGHERPDDGLSSNPSSNNNAAK